MIEKRNAGADELMPRAKRRAGVCLWKILGMLSLLVLAALPTLAGGADGIYRGVTIDGDLSDWAGVPLLATAPATNTALSFASLSAANDNDYLYLQFTLHAAGAPFSTFDTHIFIDADDNGATGYHPSSLTLGSEMLIESGNGYDERNGSFNAGTISGLDWALSPPSGATNFELRVSRRAQYSDGSQVFTNSTIRLLLHDNRGSVLIPQGLSYTFAGKAAIEQSFATNFYTVSSEDFANPERGFYIQADNKASAPSPVPSNLASYRVNGKSSPGNVYTAKISLVLRLFYLDTFTNAPISSNFLNSIQADFNSIRSQGDKAVVRFAYNKNDTRPFGEPSKTRILEHIEQLKPLLKTNSDVIAVLQQGFIAAWGEGYYTDIFYTNGQARAQHWNARAEVLNALLNALPPERMIQVRTPQMKQKFVYGPTAPTSAAPLSASEAFSGSNAARIGFHNDCYLASSTDFGTFSDYDYGGGTSAQDITNFRNYVALDTRYTPVGGETCAVNPPTDDCASAGGGADTDMALSHCSFLHQSYNANVNNDWVSQGCMENIKRRLGYRLNLVSGVFRSEAQPGQAIPLTLEFQNTGFAALFNPRGLELVFRHIVTGQKFFAALSRDTDARRWLPGTNHVLTARLSLPLDMPTGSYELLLNLPDPAPSLYGMVPYSIRLANTNALSSDGAVLGEVWEPATGYHRLGHTLTVNATATNATPSGLEIPVLNFSGIAETYETWKARHFPSNPLAGLRDADPDADGRVNLLEYAIGSDPNFHDPGSYLNVCFEDDALFVSVQKGPGVKDVAYEIEGSPTLSPATWSTSSVAILDNDASMLRVRYDGMAASGFLRLKISTE